MSIIFYNKQHYNLQATADCSPGGDWEECLPQALRLYLFLKTKPLGHLQINSGWTIEFDYQEFNLYCYQQKQSI